MGPLEAWIVFLTLAVLAILAWTVRVEWDLKFNGSLRVTKRSAGEAQEMPRPVPRLTAEDVRPRAVSR